MRTRGALVLGAILGAAVVWLWGREVEEYVQERTRAVWMKAAEGVRAVTEALRAGQEAIRHPGVDQFVRIEQGEAKFVFNGTEEHLVHDADAVVVPAGTHHNVINASTTTPLKLFTIYSPPNHPDRTAHETKSEAEAAEAAEHHR